MLFESYEKLLELSVKQHNQVRFPSKRLYAVCEKPNVNVACSKVWYFLYPAGVIEG